jgi:hypothetical protein
MIARRVDRLESWQQLSSSQARSSVHVIVSLPWRGPANLATSTRQRTLHAGYGPTELVKLDGDENSISNEHLEKFIASFPIQHYPAGSAA